MVKPHVLLISLLYTSLCTAQHHFSVYGGVNFSGWPDMETMQTSGEYTLSEHRVFESPVLGTGYRCELTDKFSLNTALQYQEVGENYYFRLDKLSGDLIKNEKWVRSDYQNLGLMVYPSLQFKIAKTNFHFYIG